MWKWGNREQGRMWKCESVEAANSQCGNGGMGNREECGNVKVWKQPTANVEMGEWGTGNGERHGELKICLTFDLKMCNILCRIFSQY
jgi:hypothetical protein